MIKIIALFGAAGAGKDTLAAAVAKKFNINPLVSVTTRPPRENEKDGVDYIFVKDEDFFKVPTIEFTQFNGWYYGTPISAIDKKGYNIGVFNIAGIKQLLKHPALEVYPFYIKCSDKERIIRQLNREEEPNCYEICRRFMTDCEDFDPEKINFKYYSIENNWPVPMIVNQIEGTMEALGKSLKNNI